MGVYMLAITWIVILELKFNFKLGSGGTGSSCDCLIIKIAMLYHDIDEMMINHVVHAELYEEARGMRKPFCIVFCMEDLAGNIVLWIWNSTASSMLYTRSDIQWRM